MPYKGETIEGQDAILDHVKQNLHFLGDIKSKALLATVKIEYEHSNLYYRSAYCGGLCEEDPVGIRTVARFIDKNGTIVAYKEGKRRVSSQVYMVSHWDDPYINEDDNLNPHWDEWVNYPEADGYGG